MQDKRSGNIWVWVGVVVLVIIVILAFVWKPSGPSTPGTGGTTSTPAGTPVYAPQGQVVQGFPPALILDPAASVNSSYSINYSASTNQYTAEWNSSLSMSALFTSYKTYLSSNGWTISSQKSKATLDGIYATNTSGAVANVAIYPQGKGNEVVVSYVQQ